MHTPLMPALAEAGRWISVEFEASLDFLTQEQNKMNTYNKEPISISGVPEMVFLNAGVDEELQSRLPPFFEFTYSTCPNSLKVQKVFCTWIDVEF